jgi:hypothetical protein
VFFGGTSAAFTVTSDGSLTATTPVGSPGDVDVEVQDASGSRQKVATYTYVSAPAPSSPSAPDAPQSIPTVVTPVQVPVPVVDPPRPSLGNPSQPAVVAPGVVLVSETQAQEAAQRVMRNEPAQKIGSAPTVNSSAGSPVALTAPGLTPGLIYQVRIKVEGEYRDLGNTQAAADGDAVLPVFRLSRVGNYTLALISPVDGSARYIKVRIEKRR